MESAAHVRMTKNAVRAMAAKRRMETRSATRHRFAHLISVRRIDSMISCRSYSGFVVSQSEGACSGERRMNAPATQKKGNTANAKGQDGA